MIIYQRNAGARFSFGVQVIFQTRMTRMTRILKLRYTYRHITPKEKRIRVIRVIRV